MTKKNELAVQNKVAKYYEYIRSNKKYTKLFNRHWYKTMANKHLKKSDLVLDNGCGNGSFANFFKGKVIGVDISEEMLKFAAKRMKVKKGSSENLPFKNETFNVVFCRSTLHHLKNPKKAIDEMQRVLKPNGKIIVSEPISNILNEFLRGSVKDSGIFLNSIGISQEKNLNPYFQKPDLNF